MLFGPVNAGLACSYVERSHKCSECELKEGEGESLRNVFHVTSDEKNMDLKINFIIVVTWGSGRLFAFIL